MPAELFSLPSAPGYRVPVRWFPADGDAAVLLMPALGVAARFYDTLAESLRQQGLAVLVMEQRGHGDSAVRASRRQDHGFREALSEDIPALLDWLHTRAPGCRTLLMGHSLGGHYAAITAGRLPARVDGVILAACGSAWVGAYQGRTRRQLQLLTGLVPALTRLLGHYPGERIGFGGREARRLMRDWLQLARHDRYEAAGLDEDLEAGIRRYDGPVLVLRMADDDYAPESAVRAVSDRFAAADVDLRVLDADMLGDRADHFRWARRPAAVTAAILSWLRAPRSAA